MSLFSSLPRTVTLAAAVFILAGSLPAADDSADGPSVELDKFAVTGTRENPSPIAPAVLPLTASTTAQQAMDTINLVDTEDAVKYFPSVFLRKRNYGDTQAVMATRTWGVSSSARSLVFADGVLLTALIANNNNIGAPRWGLVAPAEIARIDMMYGPFSAAYAGNSMGAVMEITTRMPDHFEGSVTQTEALQLFSLYGTKHDYGTHQTALTLGDRTGKFSWWFSANDQFSNSQPLTFVTAGSFPTGTTGGYAAVNKLGATANVLGAGGLLDTTMTNLKFKAAYDLTSWLQAAYTIGWWRNNASSHVETYLRDASGNPTYAGQSGFASGTYNLLQEHTAQSLTLRSDTHGNWDFEVAASYYDMSHDRQNSPTTAAATGAGLGFGSAGRIAVLDGTHWSTLDLKGLWRPDGRTGENTISFGAHDDHYVLFNPTYNVADWTTGGPYTSTATEGDGKTRTQALWVQDAWQPVKELKLTAGLRYEEWHAYDGYNVNGATVVNQPSLKNSSWSPKATLAWTVAPAWSLTTSIGQAYRYATASELYQLVSTGSTFTAPNPNLKPDNDVSVEVRLEHTFKDGSIRLSAFQDNVHDAIISQFLPLVAGSTQLYSYVSNVNHVRSRGLELVIQRSNLLVHGLDFSGSATLLDARTLATSGAANAGGASAIGKFLPNIPRWRASFLLSYRPDDRWVYALGGRYSGRLYTTLDDADVSPNNYQGFSAWFVADAHVTCHINKRWDASLGVDNLLDRKYFLFHIFPGRTGVASLKYAF